MFARGRLALVSPQAGKLDSMTDSTSGASGTVRGLNRPTTEPSGPSTNFSKFH